MATTGGRGERVRWSKRLSYVLRHDPGSVGVVLDPAGWAEVAQVLDGLRAAGLDLGRRELEQLVADSAKPRFELDADGRRIRARYGHSVPVDPAHPPAPPPPVLYHGTPAASVEAILRDGLRRMGRTQVHLSSDPGTAREVGARRGRAVFLEVDAARLHADGHELRPATAGVWLVDEVPPSYLQAR